MISLQLLGGLDLRSTNDGEIRAVLAQPKRLALLAYLALARPRGHHRRDRLVAMFWPELDQERARGALRASVHFLRRALGQGVVDSRGIEELAIDLGLFEVDVLQFDLALQEGDFERALAIYRGELLPAFHVADLPEFERWLDEERAWLARRASDAARDLRERATEAGDVTTALGWARRLVELEPFEVAGARRLAELQLLAGERGRAIGDAERFEARYRADLGSAPGADWDQWLSSLRATEPPPMPSPQPMPQRASVATHPDSHAIIVRRPRSRWRVPVALLLVFLAGAAILRGRSRLPGASDDLLVLPFNVRGAADLGYLRDGMVDLLGSRLDGATGFRTIDPQALHARLGAQANTGADLLLGQRMAEQFGGASFVLGSVVESGDQLQVSARLYSSTGRELARADGLAPRDSLFGLVDNLARALLVGRLDRPEAEVERLAAQTTRSLPALRAYLDGEHAMRGGDFATAFDDFQSATRLDTTFALAFYRLSSAADWLGKPTEARAAIARASTYRGRLESKDRMLVEARVQFWLGDAAEAERTYKQLVAVRPHSVEAWLEYGEVLFHAGPWMGRSMVESEPAFRRVLALVPGHATAMVHLARLAALQRNRLLVDSLANQLRAAEPGHSRLAEVRLLQVGLRRDSARVAVGRQALDAVDVTVRAMAVDRMAAFTGDRLTALDYALPLTSDGVAEFPRRAGLEIGAHLAAGLNRWAQSDSLLAKLALVDPLRAAQARALAVLAVADRADSARTRRALDALRSAPSARFESRTDADLRPYSALREAFYLGALSERLGDSAAVVAALESLDAGGIGATDTAAYARHAAGFLRALQARHRGQPAEALRLLESSWPAPRRALMVRWAWNHTVVLARVERAELLAELHRPREAWGWHDAAIEDIAGTPLVLGRLAVLRRLLPPR
ncbi:MAG: hypothetical protein ABIZ70_13140 [Gemmatimonadales bacterium]